jgi:putative transposase
MPRTKSKKLTPDQRRELEDLLQTTAHVKVYRRVKMLLYLDDGYPPDAIRKHTAYSERAQFFWLQRYRASGVQGLEDLPRSGRPRTRKAPAKLEHWAHLTVAQMQRNHPTAYLRTRAQMVLLWDKGYPIPSIADIVGVSPQTVRTVLAAYTREGFLGLYRQLGSGRRSVLRPEQWDQVKQWVQDGPKSVGYQFAIWTTRSLRHYLYTKFAVWLSRERLRQVLHQVYRQSWTRAKKVYAHREDPEWQAERQRFCEQMLTQVAHARARQQIVLFLDETIFTLAGELGYSWSPLGKTPEVPSLGKRDRLVVFGAVDPITGRTHGRVEDRSIHQESTLDFLKHLVRYYTKQFPGMPLVLVLDKHPGHTAGLVEEYVNQLEHVSLINTPTQSPDLNPIEHLWDWLAEQRIKNEFFETIASLKQAVRRFFSYIAGVKDQVISWLGNLQKVYTAGAEI